MKTFIFSTFLIIASLTFFGCGNSTVDVQTYNISGNIVTNNGKTLSGVKIQLNNDNAIYSNTNSNGDFIITNLPNGIYTITPLLKNYTFTPHSQQVVVNNDNISSRNFMATLNNDKNLVQTYHNKKTIKKSVENKTVQSKYPKDILQKVKNDTISTVKKTDNDSEPSIQLIKKHNISEASIETQKKDVLLAEEIESFNQYVDKNITLKAKIDQVSEVRGNIFFNIGGFFPNQKICLIIFNNDRYLFPDVQSYEGKNIVINGTVTSYRGKPQIILKNQSQLKVN